MGNCCWYCLLIGIPERRREEAVLLNQGKGKIEFMSAIGQDGNFACQLGMMQGDKLVEIHEPRCLVRRRKK